MLPKPVFSFGIVSTGIALFFLSLVHHNDAVAQNVFHDSFVVNRNICPKLRQNRPDCIVKKSRERHVTLYSDGRFNVEIEESGSVLFKASGKHKQLEREIEFVFDQTWSSENGYTYVEHIVRIRYENGKLFFTNRGRWFTGP